MTPQHCTLLIEDDPQMAAEMKSLLASLGHNCIHASTLEEVRAAIEKGGFCLALLDMQIPADASSIPLVSCGETALALLRIHDARRRANGRHILQILVVTSYSKEPDFVSRMHEMDADGFIAKPFDDRLEAVVDKIRAALARADRIDHASCEAAMLPVAAASSTAPGRVHLDIDGTRGKLRTAIHVDGRRCELQDALFSVVLRLAASHARDAEAWTTKTSLGIARSPHIPSRIRTALASYVPRDFNILEADKSGNLRLNPAVEIGRIEWALLEQHTDETIRKIAKENVGEK
jgi:CheY-like chemotaxis protein